MPTNKELTDDILALDPNAEVEGLTNPKLAALLKQLRAKQYVASKQPEIEKTAQVASNLIDVLTQGKGLGIDLSAPKDSEQQAEDKAAADPEPEVKQSEEIKTTIENTEAGLSVSFEKDDKFLDVVLPNLVDTSTGEPEIEYPATQIRTYIVAEKRAITSKRGILGPGDEVRPEYFVNGDAVIADLLKKGTIK